MGSLKLHRSLLVPMWEEARSGRFTLASSEPVALETPIRPLRDSNARLEMLFRSILAAAETDLIPRPWQLGKMPLAAVLSRAWRHPTRSTPQQLSVLVARSSSLTKPTFALSREELWALVASRV